MLGARKPWPLTHLFLAYQLTFGLAACAASRVDRDKLAAQGLIEEGAWL
jgi:hypothetical protein